MTDREKAIVMAHTGVCMLTGDKFQIFHKYVEDIMGESIYTHEIAGFVDEIKERSKQDFLKLCESLEQEPCEDCISREWLLKQPLDTANYPSNYVKIAPSVTPQPKLVDCEDCVSREAVEEAIANTIVYGESLGYAVACDILSDLPSVQPKQMWIPISERLPGEGKTVIASTEYGVYPETRYTKEYGWEWAYEAGADYWRELACVTAWMPLPERYKAESEG